MPGRNHSTLLSPVDQLPQKGPLPDVRRRTTNRIKSIGRRKCKEIFFSAAGEKLAPGATVRLADLAKSLAMHSNRCEVRSLQLGSSEFERRSMPNWTLRRWLEATPQLEVLEIGFRDLDSGTLTAIEESGGSGLRKVGLEDAFGDPRSPRKLRMEAIRGLMSRMVRRSFPSNETVESEGIVKVNVSFHGFRHLIDGPTPDCVARYSKLGRRGDRELSTARHLESFEPRRKDFVRGILGLGIGWIGNHCGLVKDEYLESEMARMAVS